MGSRGESPSASESPASASASASSALGPFAHLPTYEFDFDYRGDSIRHASSPATPNARHAVPNTEIPYTAAPALVDDFDSYMFPDADYAAEPTFTTDDTAHPSAYSSSSSSLSHPRHTFLHTRLHHHGVGAGVPPTPPPHEVDWHAVDAAELFQPDGMELDADKLYTGYTKHVVVVFVPRQAVELAGLVYGKVAHLLQQAGTRLVFVTAWTPEQARTFLSRFERVSPFPGSLVCDPHAALFAAFGFTRSPLRALFSGSKVSAPMRQGVRNALSTVSYRAQNRDIATTPVSSKRLKCGAVVMPTLRGYAKRPLVAYHREESPPTGVGCYLDVLQACGVNEAFVPDIDVSQVYMRFNNMRATSIKTRVADEKEANRLQSQKHRGSRSKDRRNALKG